MACPESWPADGPVLLLLLARGLEDVAIRVLQDTMRAAQQPDPAHLHRDACVDDPGCQRVASLLPRLDERWAAICATKDETWCAAPRGEEGEAYVGKLLLRLDGLAIWQQKALVQLVMSSGLFQGVLAFLAGAEGLSRSGARSGRGAATSFHGSLRQIEELVAKTPRWRAARALQGEASRLRGSCVRDGHHEGFRCQDAMAAMGAGALAAQDFQIDLYGYDVELMGFFSGEIFTCGLWLGPEWRVNPQGEIYGGPERNFHCVPVGDRRRHLPYDVRKLPRLRPSTALLLLHLAQPRAGELLLDVFGGVGTIAVEAACSFPGLTCISSDKDPSACHTAALHCRLAKSMCAIQPGSSVERRQWDARKLKLADASVDLVVSDLPFLNRCAFDFESAGGGAPSARQGLAAVLRELARVLRLREGPSLVLLVQSRHIFEDALRYSNSSLKLQDTASNPRAVVIGGAACWVFLLQKAKRVTEVEDSVERGPKLLVFRKKPGVPAESYICRCCQRPGHWRDRCPILPRKKAEIQRRATI